MISIRCPGLGFCFWLFLSAGCRRGDLPTAGVPGPLASALLALAAEQGTPPPEVARTWRAIEDLAIRVSAMRPGAGARAGVVDAIARVLFDQVGFQREVERTDPEFLLLPSVVAGRRGSCVGLGALVLAIGETLGIPIAGVMVPGHFFVRELGPGAHNVELLRRGETMPDAWYVGKYGPWAPSASAYLRPLEIPEVIAVHWFNIGNLHRIAGDLPGAAAAYRQAVEDFPTFAEAAASLGAVLQLRGDLQGAILSYDAAARARPDLPGLAHNLSVLELAILDSDPSVLDKIGVARSAASPTPQPRPLSRDREPESGQSPRRSTP